MYHESIDEPYKKDEHLPMVLVPCDAAYIVYKYTIDLEDDVSSTLDYMENLVDGYSKKHT